MAESSAPQLVLVLPMGMARGQSAVSTIFADFLHATPVAKHETQLGGFRIHFWGDSVWLLWILSESAVRAILGLGPQEKLVAVETWTWVPRWRLVPSPVLGRPHCSQHRVAPATVASCNKMVVCFELKNTTRYKLEPKWLR